MLKINVIRRTGNSFNTVDAGSLVFGYAEDCAMSRDGSTIAIASSIGLQLYSLSDGGVEHLSDPDIFQYTPVECSLSNDGKFLSVVDKWSPPSLLTYIKSGSNYVNLPDPNVLPDSGGLSCALSGDGSVLAVVYESSPSILIYAYDGTKYVEATNMNYTPPDGSILKCDLSESGKDLVLFLNSHPFVMSYTLKGSAYKRLPDPDILPTSPCTGGISGDGTVIICVQSNEPKLLTYEKRIL